MKLSDFSAKHVPGLYAFTHFEHASGAFIQRSLSLPTYWVYRNPTGEMTEYYDAEALRVAVAKD